MKYALQCKDLNIPGAGTCTYEAVNEDREALMAEVLAHATSQHRVEIEGLSEKEILERMREKIHEEE